MFQMENRLSFSGNVADERRTEVMGRLRLGRISCPTMALMVVDLPAFIVPTTASTISCGRF